MASTTREAETMGVLQIPPPAPGVGRLLAAAGGGVVCVLLGVATAVQPLAVAGLVVVAAGALLAVLRPEPVAAVAVALLGVVPVYAAPKVGPLDLDPVVFACWAAAAGILLRVLVGQERVRLHVLDGAVALYLGLLALPVLFDVRDAGEYLQVLASTAGPYLALRLVVPRVRPEWAPAAFAVAALLALPFVLYEGATSTNPFLGLAFNPVESATWTDEQMRFGVRRAEGAFGHAIALSSFCGTVMVLALGSAALSRRAPVRWAWLVAVVAAAAMLALSASRTGWIIFALGTLLVAARVVSGRTRAELVGVIVAVAALAALPIVALGAGSSLVRLVADEELSGSNNYREILLQRALRGEGLALFGMRESPLGAGIESGGVGVSIDNAYLAVASEWGYVGGVGLALVGLGVLYVLLRQPRGTWALLPAVALANFVGLAAVAIFTQTEFWLWMLVGAAAGAHAVVHGGEGRAAAPAGAWDVARRRSRRH